MNKFSICIGHYQEEIVFSTTLQWHSCKNEPPTLRHSGNDALCAETSLDDRMPRSNFRPAQPTFRFSQLNQHKKRFLVFRAQNDAAFNFVEKK
jgi:hypothetical protein